MDVDHHSLLGFTHCYSLDAFHEQMLPRPQKNHTVMSKCNTVHNCICWEGIKLYVVCSTTGRKLGAFGRRTLCNHQSGFLMLWHLSTVITFLTQNLS